MTPVLLRPGHGQPGGVARRFTAARRSTVDPACRAAIRRGADAVERIVAKGEPVYGINTGFGKLASVRIATATSRPCSATSCCRMRPAWARQRPRRSFG